MDIVLKYIRRLPPQLGIIHAFNGSMAQAQAFLQNGFKLGYGGAMSYDGSKRIRKILSELPVTLGTWRRLSGYAAELGARRKQREPRKRPCGHGLLRRSCCGIKKYDDRRNLGTEHSKHTQSDPEIRSVNFRLLRRKKSFCFLKEGFCLANIKTVSTITVAESGEFVLINCQDRK